MEDLDAASLDDVKAFFRTYYAPNNAVLSVVGDCRPGAGPRVGGQLLRRRSRPTRRSRRCRDMSLPPLLGDGAPRDGPGPRAAAADLLRVPRAGFGDHRLDALDLAGQILAGGKGTRLHRRLVRDERLAQDVAIFSLPFTGGASISVGWATVRPGVDLATVEAAYLEELERLGRELLTDDELARAKALTEADELGALAAGRGARGPAVDVRDAVRRPGPDQQLLPRYLSMTAEQIRDVAARGVPRRQPRRPDVRAGPQTAGRRRASDDREEAA